MLRPYTDWNSLPSFARTADSFFTSFRSELMCSRDNFVAGQAGPLSAPLIPFQVFVRYKFVT